MLSGDVDGARRISTELSGLPSGTNLAPPMEFFDGDWQAAEAHIRRDRERARAAGDRFNECGLERWLAQALRLAGDSEQAGNVLGDGLEVVASGGHRLLEIWFGLDLALLAAEAGRVQEAAAHLERARGRMRAGEEWRGLAGRVALAEGAIQAAAGDLTAAGPLVDRAVEIFRRYSVPWDEAEAHLFWGRARLQAGDVSGATNDFKLAADIYRRCTAGEGWLERIADQLGP